MSKRREPVRVLIFKVGRTPSSETWEPNKDGGFLDHLQREIGGNVDCVELGGGIDLWVSDDMLHNGAEFNRTFDVGGEYRIDVYGACVLARTTRRGRLASVTEDDVQKWKSIVEFDLAEVAKRQNDSR